ncbi:uncharacterized protein LOC141906315 [Tubulanus polymorphus]|uniref:uncharacterized protein LOC141906315 n=1 Tax=Tubulanus polymorphus TaxID=672921 RepID=UPI003DA31AE0
MSKMSGDNLSLLRSSMRQAEMSPRVQSFNLATRVEMMRKINWCFREQNLTVDRMNKAQFQTFKDLKRVHQDKRRMMRASWQYKQEEARLQIERDTRDRKVQQILDEYDYKSREILGELFKTKLQKRKLNPIRSNDDDDATDKKNKVDLLKIEEDEIANDEKNEGFRQNRKKSVTTAVHEEPLIKKPTEEDVELLTTENLKNHDLIIKASQKQDEKQPKPYLVRESSKVLEVNLSDLGDPITRRRIREESNEDVSNSVNNNEKPLKTEPELNDTFIAQISDANKPIDDEKVTGLVAILPPIGELSNINSSQTEKEVRTSLETSCQDREQNDDAKNMTMLEFMRKKAKETELMKKQILEEPYTAYTRDKRGNIVPLEVPPKPFDSDVPSTRAIYLRDKALERQIEINHENENRIQKFFAKMEREEEEKIRKENLASKARRRQQKIEAKLSKAREIAERKLPPMTMTAFLQKYPEEWDLNGLDPDSVEVLKRCRYIRFKDGTIKEIDSDIQTALADMWNPKHTKT